MVNFYAGLFLKFYWLFLLVAVLSFLLVVLNKIIFKFLKLKSNSQLGSKNKGLETYEFGTHSVGMISTISSNQIFILAIIFLLFDIEIIFLVPWILNLNLTWVLGNLGMLFFSNLILYSFFIELYLNILVWYKNKKTKFI